MHNSLVSCRWSTMPAAANFLLLFYFLQLYCPNGFSPMGNFDCFSWGKPAATVMLQPTVHAGCYNLVLFMCQSSSRKTAILKHHSVFRMCYQPTFTIWNKCSLQILCFLITKLRPYSHWPVYKGWFSTFPDSCLRGIGHQSQKLNIHMLCTQTQKEWCSFGPFSNTGLSVHCVSCFFLVFFFLSFFSGSVVFF